MFSFAYLILTSRAPNYHYCTFRSLITNFPSFPLLLIYINLNILKWVHKLFRRESCSALLPIGCGPDNIASTRRWWFSDGYLMVIMDRSHLVVRNFRAGNRQTFRMPYAGHLSIHFFAEWYLWPECAVIKYVTFCYGINCMGAPSVRTLNTVVFFSDCSSWFGSKKYPRDCWFYSKNFKFWPFPWHLWTEFVPKVIFGEWKHHERAD